VGFASSKQQAAECNSIHYKQCNSIASSKQCNSIRHWALAQWGQARLDGMEQVGWHGMEQHRTIPTAALLLLLPK
jgi:hypothetical protein